MDKKNLIKNSIIVIFALLVQLFNLNQSYFIFCLIFYFVDFVKIIEINIKEILKFFIIFVIGNIVIIYKLYYFEIGYWLVLIFFVIILFRIYYSEFGFKKIFECKLIDKKRIYGKNIKIFVSEKLKTNKGCSCGIFTKNMILAEQAVCEIKNLYESELFIHELNHIKNRDNLKKELIFIFNRVLICIFVLVAQSYLKTWCIILFLFLFSNIFRKIEAKKYNKIEKNNLRRENV